MLEFQTEYNEMATRILYATESLIAKESVQNVSMHKVAKEAGVSVGSIYVHFKDKDDLFHHLISFLFQKSEQYFWKNFDPMLPLAEQYRAFWKGHWAFLQEHPNTLINIYQYRSLPQFHFLCQRCSESS